jgi:hypothetical protein
MPLKVPQRERQVALQPLPAARQISPAGAADFGALEAEAIGKIGGQVERLGRTAVAVEEREELLAAQFKEERDKLLADNALVEFKDNLRSQKQIFFNRRGIDAHGVHNESNEYIEKLKKEMKAKMENDEIRTLFEARTTTSRELLLNQTITHEASEFKKLKDDNINANIDNSILDASNAASEPNSGLVIDSAMLDLEFALDQKVESEGMTSAAAKNFKDEKRSTFHLSVLNRKVALNAVDAKEYYDKNKKQIAPDKRDNTEIVIENSLIEEESKEITNVIFIQESDFIKQTETAFDLPERNDHEEAVKKEVKKKLKVKQDETNQLTAEKRNEVLDNTTESIKIANSLGEANDAISTLKANRHDLGITTAQINGLEGYANSRFKAKKEKIVTDPVVKERIDRLVTQGKITTLNQYIREAGGKLSQEDLEKASGFIAKGGQVGNVQEGKLRSKFNEIMNMAPKEDPFLYKLARDYVVDQVKATGKDPTDTNIDEWMGEALLSGFETETLDKLFTIERQITVIEAIERGVPFTTEITEDEKADITADLKAHNSKSLPEDRIRISNESVEIIFLRDQGFTDEQIRQIMFLGTR